ncbi:MAG: isoleucine--tRNA ligase [Candidatus Sumerlaeia bacterium]
MDQQKIDYKDTLNLPRTDFPMQAKLPQREPEMLARWQAEDLYGQTLEHRKDAPDYVLHDGPPYANGDIHMGHALNKILKDLLVRYQTMTGHRVYFVPGWDCHGLPIEQKVMEKLGHKARELDPVHFRRECHNYAQKWIDIQREQFKRLGIGADWDHPYLTIQPEVETGILTAFREIVARGLVRKGFRPVYWDTVFQTALAEAEIEYQEHTSESIYVKFPLVDSGSVPGLEGLDGVSIVIWTTTPWTLPANLAVCLHPEFEYVVVKSGDDEHYIVAKELADAFIKECKLEGTSIVGQVKPRALEGKVCRHPIFPGKSSLVILGLHVTLEAGTGAVHTAPGHGADDFHIGRQYGLPVFVPVDEAGRFTADYPEMQGEKVFDANPKIVEKLKVEGLLLAHGKIKHQYPFSWRSHKPIIFRATEQWFMELDQGGVRERALDAIDHKVEWIPEWGHDRIYNMVEARPDWCLSRQRAWGVPIPSIHSKTEGKSILNLELIDKFIAVVREKGTDAWFSEPLDTFWPEGFVHEPTGECRPDQFEKEFEVLDVWFDSGSTHIAVLEQREGLSSPADMYLEGSDQHRGWFQASLLVGMGARDHSPFKSVLTHGFVLDEKGEPMSKSKGNVISPQEIVQQIGADGLRLWVVSEDYRSDVRIARDKLKQISEAYRRIRNTFKFLLSNLFDFDASQAVPLDQLEEFDRWILGQLDELVERVRQAYDKYEFHRVYHYIHNFCGVSLSALYLDVVKDRLYCSAPNDPTRRAAQTVCHYLLDTIVRLVAPILVFTADEVWQFGQMGPEKSVHMADMPGLKPEWRDAELSAKWEKILDLRGRVSAALEEKRRAKEIGHSLDACVIITAADDPESEFLTKNLALLKNLFIVSDVQIQPPAGAEKSAGVIAVAKAGGAKCERCWMLDPQVGRHPRHPGLCPRCADVVGRMS